VEGSCEHGNEPAGSINVGKCLSSRTAGGLSRRAQLHEVIYLYSEMLRRVFWLKITRYKIPEDNTVH
jgi:hypothetical protein